MSEHDPRLEELPRLRALLAEGLQHARHSAYCAKAANHRAGCTCGLAEWRAQVGEAMKP